MSEYSSSTLWQLDACEMAQGIVRGDFSSRELVSACLERMEEVNPLINAITEARAEDALANADAADKAFAADKNSLGILHGVPVTIKHNVDLQGWPTVHGSEALKDNIAQGNSDCVQNWLDAGAIVIGRTNNPEFCCRWETSNELFGVTHNPWDRTRTPGGSSGGAAASLAVGIGPLAHGTDLGGSLRHPAQACGVASIKPSFGRVADWHPSDQNDPAIGYQLLNTDGPMARHVRDVRLGLQAMSARSYHDPWWAPAPLVSKAKKKTVALVTNPAGGGIDPQVAAGVELAGQLLASAGYKVEEVEPPHIEEAAELWRIICVGELTSQLIPAVEGFCGNRLRTVFEYYKAMAADFSLDLYMNAFARRRQVLRAWLEFFETYDHVVAPICTEPPLVTDGDLASLEVAEKIVRSHRMTVAVSALSLPAAVVPVGVSEGMPQAVQIIGAPFTEMDCLDAAEAIERQVVSLTPINPN